MNYETFRDTLEEYFVKAGRVRSTTLLKKLFALREVGVHEVHLLYICCGKLFTGGF